MWNDLFLRVIWEDLIGQMLPIHSLLSNMVVIPKPRDTVPHLRGRKKRLLNTSIVPFVSFMPVCQPKVCALKW